MKAEQLRKSILQLAIQGKLVPQDPADEPASVLLERIRAEKQRLIKEGKIKKDKGDSVIFKGDDNCYYEKTGSEVKNITDEIPFDIPDSWCWVRLYDIVFIETGKKDANFGDASGKYNFYTCAMEPIKAKSYSYDGDYLILPGNGANVGMSIHYIGKFEAYQRTYLLSKKTNDISFPYLQIILNAYWKDYNKDKQYGSAIPYIKLGNLENFLVPMTSYKEQERIVAEIKKFEPLIAEYDKLEQQATKLDGEIYDKLKKSILQYAIQGKLVPQDSNDEPAAVLLERIRTEKKAQLGKKYVESYIYKGDDNYYYEKVGSETKNITDEIPFDIPDSWSWARLDNLCSYIHRGKSPQYGTDKILPIIAQKCNQWSGIQTEKCLFADKNTISKYSNEQFIRVGDILINSTGTGTVGRTGIVEADLFKDYPKFVADSHVTVVRVSSMIVAKYVWFFLKSPFIQRNIEEKCSGSTNQIELATSTIANYLVPISSHTEQCKIVDKITNIYEMIKGEI